MKNLANFPKHWGDPFILSKRILSNFFLSKCFLKDFNLWFIYWFAIFFTIPSSFPCISSPVLLSLGTRPSRWIIRWNFQNRADYLQAVWCRLKFFKLCLIVDTVLAQYELYPNQLQSFSLEMTHWRSSLIRTWMTIDSSCFAEVNLYLWIIIKRQLFKCALNYSSKYMPIITSFIYFCICRFYIYLWKIRKISFLISQFILFYFDLVFKKNRKFKFAFFFIICLKYF